MSLRSTLTTLLGMLPSLRIRATCAGAAMVGGLIVVSVGYGGCGGGGSSLVCDDAGLDCQVCDALGCRPATMGTGGSGSGGAATGGSGVTGGGGVGGSAPCDPQEATCPCVDGACTDGKQCIDGLCITGCNFTYQCAAGDVCDNGACVPGCGTTVPCPTGYSCENGACALDPTDPQCSATVPCPSGEICANGLCTTQCTADSQCAAGQVCNGGTHTCIDNPSPQTTCSATIPCPPPEMCEADGYCHYPCTDLSDCKLIDNRFVACNQGVCKSQEEVDPECTLTMPCPAGKSCISNICY